MKSQNNPNAIRALLGVLAFGSMNCEVITALDRSQFPFDKDGGLAGAGGQAGQGGTGGLAGQGGAGGLAGQGGTGGLAGQGGTGGLAGQGGAGGLAGQGGAAGGGGMPCVPESDNNPCTDDVCENGVPVSKPAAIGTACSMGGIQCDGMGACVECLAPTDCAGGDDTCRTRTCAQGKCGNIFAPVGTSLPMQTDGDCKNDVCDGNGATIPSIDDTDLPDDMNDCTDDVCAAGVASNPNKAQGTVCGMGLVCNAVGACIGCNTPLDCAGTDDECKMRTCVNSSCDVAFTPMGTAVSAQTAGNCLQAVCDGNGSIADAADDADLPSDDGNACTDEACNAGAASHPPKANGFPCTDGDACTQTDTCQAGSCTGANLVICAPLDQCHIAGTCNPADGMCSNPNETDGVTCSDNDACTQTDTCQAGNCTGANLVICAPLDQCHIAGTCNPADGMCSNPNEADGAACADGDACTQTDTCQAGNCTGANLVICPAPTTCPNPVGWWPAENNANGFYGLLDGMLGAGVTFAPGEVGQAFSFNGSNDVGVPDDPALTLGTAFTVEAWINYTIVDGSLQTIISKNRSNGGTGFAMNVVSGHLGIGVHDGIVSFGTSGTMVIPTNTWVHVAATRNLNVVNLYVNGVLDATFTGAGMNPLINSTQRLTIGSEDTVGGRFFTGLIDEVAVYNTELSNAAIAAIVAAGPVGKCQSDSVCNSMSGACNNTVTTCLTLLTGNPALTDGNYLIDPDGAGPNQPFTAYCDMTNGGWTLIQSHNAGVSSSLAASVGLASGKYLPSGSVQAIANAGTSVRINQRSGSLAIESADSFPITKLRALTPMQDDATKDATHWTGTGTGKISYIFDTAGQVYPVIYHASGNASGLHVLAGSFNLHGFSYNSENLDVWVK